MPVRPVIELRGVSFSYDGEPILKAVDLDIDERDFVTIVGPNGGGKTTLLKLILGLIHPTAGTVRVFGRSPADARARIGYVPQHSQADQSFPVRVLDVVLTGRLDRRRVFGGYSPADREAAIEALREVELCDHAARPFAALSGGLRQRTLIARALASQPDVLLMDEPTANLDVMMEGELYALLRRLHERLTILLVTHDLGFVSDFSKTVVCVKRTIAVHPTGELTGDLISEMYGRDVRAVLHDPDHHTGGGC
jgi:zinc transport system ATP-binding protein